MGTISISPIDGREKYCSNLHPFQDNGSILLHKIKAKESDT